MKPDKTLILIRKFEGFQQFLNRFEFVAGDGDNEWQEIYATQADEDDWLTPKSLFRCCNPDIEIKDTLLNFLHTHRTPYQLRSTYDEDGTDNFATYLADLDSNTTNVFRVLDPDGERIYAPMGVVEPTSTWRAEPPHLQPCDLKQIFISKLLFS
jgi:hypothetical protein